MLGAQDFMFGLTAYFDYSVQIEIGFRILTGAKKFLQRWGTDGLCTGHD